MQIAALRPIAHPRLRIATVPTSPLYTYSTLLVALVIATWELHLAVQKASKSSLFVRAGISQNLLCPELLRRIGGQGIVHMSLWKAFVLDRWHSGGRLMLSDHRTNQMGEPSRPVTAWDTHGDDKKDAQSCSACVARNIDASEDDHPAIRPLYDLKVCATRIIQ